MLKKLFLYHILFIIGALAFAEDSYEDEDLYSQTGRQVDVGAGVDLNGYSTDNLSYALALSADWRFMAEFSTGLRFALNFDFNIKKVVEISSVVRFFFIRSSFFESFLGGEIGYAQISSDDIVGGNFIAAVNAGCRFLFVNGENFPPWYLEPHVRFGYPFLWGTGLVLGYRLPSAF